MKLKQIIKDIGFNKLAKHIHLIAHSKGFWPRKRTDAECMALIHSEVSEALEALRKPMFPKTPYLFYTRWERKMPPKPSGISEELADIIIRVLDFAGAKNIDINKAIKMKIEYNKVRKYKHGKKF